MDWFLYGISLRRERVKGIQKKCFSLLRFICSIDNDYTAKSKEYTKYLVNRGHDLNSVQQCFHNVGKTSRQEVRKKVKPRNAENLIVFSRLFNLHGPNFNKIINRNIHLLLNNYNLKELYPKGSILVANKSKNDL